MARSAGHRDLLTVFVMSYDLPAHTLPPWESSPLPPGFTTMLHVLRFLAPPAFHAVLRNVLVDHNSVERTLLVPDDAAALRVLHDTPFW